MQLDYARGCSWTKVYFLQGYPVLRSMLVLPMGPNQPPVPPQDIPYLPTQAWPTGLIRHTGHSHVVCAILEC